MIPTLLPALERHGRLKLVAGERALVLRASAATIDRLLTEVKIAAAGGRRRRAGFSSAVRCQVPVRTFSDWGAPPRVIAKRIWLRMAAHRFLDPSSRR
jgi:hypothetical protein